MYREMLLSLFRSRDRIIFCPYSIERELYAIADY
jgi:hypothetical protein